MRRSPVGTDGRGLGSVGVSGFGLRLLGLEASTLNPADHKVWSML